MNNLDDIRMEILEAKESRWNFQMELLAIYHQPIISFKLNIPSWPKVSESIQQAFNLSLADFQFFLQKMNLDSKLIAQKITLLGPEAFFISSIDAKKLKQLTITFEENHKIGRLIDIDVIDITKKIVDRNKKRTCFLCDRIAINCMREEHHNQSELRDYFDERIQDYLKEK